MSSGLPAWSCLVAEFDQQNAKEVRMREFQAKAPGDLGLFSCPLGMLVP